jgi:hypothetical protein
LKNVKVSPWVFIPVIPLLTGLCIWLAVLFLSTSDTALRRERPEEGQCSVAFDGGEGESLRDDVGVQSHLAGDIMGPGAWSCVA